MSPAALRAVRPIDQPTPHSVRLLDVDVDWRHGLPRDAVRSAVRHIVLPTTTIAPGTTWAVTGPAMVLLEGRALRTTVLAGRRTVQLLGVGDVIASAGHDAGSPGLIVGYEALGHLRVATLDDTFVRAGQRWPSLTNVLINRLLAQEHRALLQFAISALPCVEQRLLAMLWHLAERFGRVTAQGVTLDVQLTHAQLGELVGSRRPTVSLACKKLEELGAAHRSGARGWVLPLDAAGLLDGPWSGRPVAESTGAAVG